jgi:hypothetical protein
MHRTNAVKEGDIVFVFVKVAACFHQLMVCDFAVFFLGGNPSIRLSKRMANNQTETHRK